MKLLHVINSLHYGGAEKLLLDIIPEFKKRGVDVEVMVLYNEKTAFYKVLEYEHNITVIAPGKLKRLYNLSHLFWVRKHIKNYDIVHVHLFPTLYWVGIASLFLIKKPKLVLSEHNTENRRRASFFLKGLDSFIYKRYDTIVGVSSSVLERLTSYLDSKSVAIRLINNGVSLAPFKKALPYKKSDLNLPEDTRVIIQISSFTAQKDQATLIRAIALLAYDVHLLLVGYGVTIEEHQQLAIDLKVASRVHFLGYRTDIARLLKTAHICVLSSHYEGFGLAIVEGMAAGLPCIGSKVDGLSQVIGDAGILFDPGDHSTLKEAIEVLMTNETYYKELSQKSMTRAQLFDISLMIQSHMDLYKELNQ